MHQMDLSLFFLVVKLNFILQQNEDIFLLKFKKLEFHSAIKKLQTIIGVSLFPPFLSIKYFCSQYFSNIILLEKGGESFFKELYCI